MSLMALETSVFTCEQFQPTYYFSLNLHVHHGHFLSMELKH